MEKISRQYNVESMVRLVLIMHMQVYNTGKQVSQEEIQDAHSLERKKITGKLHAVAKAHAERENVIAMEISFVKEESSGSYLE